MICRLAVVLVTGIIFSIGQGALFAQKTPTGNPADFKVKTCLHSVSYAGFWRGQERLTVDKFLVKAKELGLGYADGPGKIWDEYV